MRIRTVLASDSFADRVLPPTSLIPFRFHKVLGCFSLNHLGYSLIPTYLVPNLPSFFLVMLIPLFRYKGNFSYYLEKKAEREEQLQSTVDKARNTFRKELDWIRRQPKARGTKQKARVDAFEGIKSTAQMRLEEDEMELPVKMERLGSKIVEFHKIGKAYGEKTILHDFSYHFQRKERLGIVGNNGTGKSTFLNLLIGQDQADKGKVVIGDTIVFWVL